LLGATFLHHLSKYQSSQPAVQALRNDRYVDDLVTGARNDETIALAEEATRTCREAGFTLGKFSSNSKVTRERLVTLKLASVPDE